MGYLLVCILSAAAMAYSVFLETASLWLAFAAYSLTGTLVLFSVLADEMIATRASDQFNTTD